MKKKLISLLLCMTLCIGTLASLTGCGKNNAAKGDAFVIMTEQLDGLFNPFFSPQQQTEQSFP